MRVQGGEVWPLPLPADAPTRLTLGLRAGGLREAAREGDVRIDATVSLAEIAGSDTFVHVHSPVGELVAQLTGVHNLGLGAAIALYLDPRQLFVFDAGGPLVSAPARSGGTT